MSLSEYFIQDGGSSEFVWTEALLCKNLDDIVVVVALQVLIADQLRTVHVGFPGSSIVRIYSASLVKNQLFCLVSLMLQREIFELIAFTVMSAFDSTFKFATSRASTHQICLQQRAGLWSQWCQGARRNPSQILQQETPESAQDPGCKAILKCHVRPRTQGDLLPASGSVQHKSASRNSVRKEAAVAAVGNSMEYESERL